MGDEFKIDKIQFVKVLKTSQVSEEQIEVLWKSYQTTGKLPDYFQSLLNVSNKDETNKPADNKLTANSSINTVFSSSPLFSDFGLGIEKSIKAAPPKMEGESKLQQSSFTYEQSKDYTINYIGNSTKQSIKAFKDASENEGVVSKGYNSVKEFFDTKLAKSSVARGLYAEQTGVYLMDRANKGDLTKNEYYDSKMNLLMKLVPGSQTMSDSDKAILREKFSIYSPEDLNKHIDQLKTCSDETYQALGKAAKKAIKQEKAFNVQPIEGNNRLKKHSIDNSYHIQGGDELITFEEVFASERVAEYKKENIEKFNEKSNQLTLATTVQEKNDSLHKLLDENISLLRENNEFSVSKEAADASNMRMETSFVQSMKSLYGDDSEKINDAMKKLNGGDSITYENGKLKYSEFAQGTKSYGLASMAEKLLAKTDENCKKVMGGKKLEDYEQDYANTYLKTYGEKNAKELTQAYTNDQEGFVQKTKMAVQVGGMVVAVGGLFVPGPGWVATAGVATSTFGGTAVGALNEATRKNGMSEDAKNEIKKEIGMNIAFLGLGVGAGALGTTARAALVAKNCPKMVAFVGEYGTNAVASLIGDMALNGELDLKQESFGQAMILISSIAAHKKLTAGNAMPKTELTTEINKELPSIGPNEVIIRDAVAENIVKPINAQVEGGTKNLFITRAIVRKLEVPTTELPKTNVNNNPGVTKIADRLNISPEKRVNIANTTKEIFSTTNQHFEEIKGSFEKTFQDVDGVELQIRVKAEDGLEEKAYRILERVVTKKNKLVKKLDAAASDVEKNKINRQIAEQDQLFEALTVEYSILHANLNDGLGQRIIMSNPSSQNVDKVVQKIISGIEKDEFRIGEIENYGADENHLYFNQEQIDRIKTACKKKGINAESANKYKDSGYTSTQMDLIYKNGVRCELQFRGNKIHEWSESEHLLHDFAEGKDVAKGNKEIENLLKPIYDALRVKNANPELKEAYNKYGKDCYKEAWDIEMSNPTKPLTLPGGVPKELDKQYIIKTHKQLVQIQNKSK